MGRWAAAQRRRGKRPISNSIISATRLSATEIDITYESVLPTFGLQTTWFRTEPSSTPVDEIIQQEARTFRLNMDGDVTADTTLVYDGNRPGLVSPQVLAL